MVTGCAILYVTGARKTGKEEAYASRKSTLNIMPMILQRFL